MTAELLVLGIVTGANNLATSLALGAVGLARRRGRIVGVFAGFEFAVPLAGMWMGQRFATLIEASAGWLAAALVAGVGGWTIIAAIRQSIDEAALARRAASWSGLFLLAAILSVDNLVVGFGLGLGERDPLLVAGTIAVFSAAFAWFGLSVGHLARGAWRQGAEFGSGLLLLALAAGMALGWI